MTGKYEPTSLHSSSDYEPKTPIAGKSRASVSAVTVTMTIPSGVYFTYYSRTSSRNLQAGAESPTSTVSGRPAVREALSKKNQTQSFLTMIRSLPRRLRTSSLASPRSSRSFVSQAIAYKTLSQDVVPRRSYATETAMPPSGNDMFANGANAYYAEE